MKKVKVINQGKRMRERLGSRFLPRQEKVMKVSDRQHLELKAVRDFKVEVLDKVVKPSQGLDAEKVVTKIEVEEKTNEVEWDATEHSSGDSISNLAKDLKEYVAEESRNGVTDKEINFHELTIDEVIEIVSGGACSIDEAIAHEVSGKNRKTLLDRLEKMKSDEQS